jgi:hypothetical protein
MLLEKEWLEVPSGEEGKKAEVGDQEGATLVDMDRFRWTWTD